MDLHPYQVVHRHAGFAEDILKTLEEKINFGIDTLWRLARRRVEADSSRNVESIAHLHGIAERQTRWTIRQLDVTAMLG